MRIIALRCAVLAPMSFASISQGAQGGVPRWPVRQELRIDGAAADLVPFTYFAVGPRGEIVIPQRQDNRVLVFDSAGRRVSTLGRRGAGPGEFIMLGMVGWVRDTIWAEDQQRQRINYFLRDGSFVGQRPFPRSSMMRNPLGGTAAMTPRGATMFEGIDLRAVYPGSEGALFFATQVEPGSTVRCPCFVWVSSNNATRSVVRWYSDWADPFRREGPNASAAYEWYTQWAASQNGTLFVFLTSTDQERRDGRFRVTLRRRDGDTVYSRLYPFEKVPVTSADVRAALDAELARRRTREAQGARSTEPPPTEAEMRRRLTEYSLPYIGGRIGDDSTVWVRLRTTGADAHWLILDRAGRPTGSVVLPPSARVFHVRGGQAWTIHEDADGFQSIARYGIVR